jgi:hypothetical protein
VIARHRLPPVLLTDLLDAFRQDLTQTRYADRAQLLDYCRRSANPVGRLLLHLYVVTDAQALRESDAICSALQLANFWQDLSIDTARGRLYIPRADCERHGVAAADLLARCDGRWRGPDRRDGGWRRLCSRGTARAPHRWPGAGWELRLWCRAACASCKRIEQGGFDAAACRPRLHWHDVPTLAWRALRMRPTAARAVEEPAMTPEQYVTGQMARNARASPPPVLNPPRRAAITAFTPSAARSTTWSTKSDRPSPRKLAWWRAKSRRHSMPGQPRALQALMPHACSVRHRTAHLAA